MDLLKDLNIDKIRNAAEDALNQVKPKTDVEARVYEVLSHKNWGASSSIMNQIARDTFDYEKFAIITKITWENVETQRPSAWRVIFKGLTLVEHLVKNGSERCVDDARNHGHILRKLHQFNYYEGTIDRGLGVREKSKQLVEILSDNDRVREERQKARKLREKFGGRAGAASSSGGGGGGYSGGGWDSAGGGGGGGGGDWESGGGSGGYGDGGIDSGRSSRGGARGRYDDEDRGATSSSPTFAQAPTKKKGTKKGKKKKAPAADSAPPAPEVDLFSFDDPAPTPAPPASAGHEDEFSGFHSAAPAAGVSDPFGGDPFSNAPNNNASQQAAAADPFAIPTPQSNNAPQQPDPFAAPSTQPPMSAGGMNNMANMFGNMNMGGGTPQQAGMMGGANAMMNNTVMMGGSNVMGGYNAMMGGATATSAPAPAPVVADDDDFGDFEGGQQASKPAAASSDPFGNLVSLDGLSKNTGQQDKLNQPIVANPAAAQYLEDKQQGVGAAAPQNTAKNVAMSFAGIDGLPKMSAYNSAGMSGGMGMSMVPPPVAGMNSNVMASGGSGNASAIGMLDPAAMAPKPAPQQQQQQQQGMMNPQQMMMMMQSPQMMQQFMANATPQQQQQMQQMMMMMQQQMMAGGGGMGGNNNNMMGGQGGSQMNGGASGAFQGF